MGNEIEMKDAEKQCDPIVTNEDMGVVKSVNGQNLTPGDVAIPCGLIAKSFFTDKYKLVNEAGTDQTIDSSDIAWKSDVEFKFKNQEGDWKTKQWLDITDRKLSLAKTLTFFFYRAFHCVDAYCRFTKLQEVVRSN